MTSIGCSQTSSPYKPEISPQLDEVLGHERVDLGGVRKSPLPRRRPLAIVAAILGRPFLRGKGSLGVMT